MGFSFNILGQVFHFMAKLLFPQESTLIPSKKKKSIFKKKNLILYLFFPRKLLFTFMAK